MFQLSKRNLLKCYKRFYSLPFYRYVKHDHKKSAKLWYYLTLLTIPVAGFVGFLTISREIEHMKHMCHVDTSILKVKQTMNKPFPWGDGETPLFEFLFKEYKERVKRKICDENDESHGDGEGEQKKCVRKSKS